MPAPPQQIERRLKGDERAECFHCGTPRYADGGDRVVEANEHTFCSASCAHLHALDQQVRP